MPTNSQVTSKFDALKEALVTKVEKCLLLAEQNYAQSFPYDSLLINIRGKTAGQVRYYPNLTACRPVLRFNPTLLERYEQQFIDEVVPHECAHLVVYTLYQGGFNFRKKIKPHGIEWQKVMTDLYGLDPKVTHSFSVDTIPKEKFIYQCDCEGVLHHLSIVRHNKILRQQAEYRCKNCQENLIFKVGGKVRIS